MEHYGWCVGALWVVCGSIRERNYRLKKKNYLSGPNVATQDFVLNFLPELRNLQLAVFDRGK